MRARPNLAETFAALSALARAELRSQSRTPAYSDKGVAAFDPVTELDRAIERAVRGHLVNAFPDHGVWGEEDGWSNQGAELHWSVDPIDGTRALICGLPSWCMLVGYLESGQHAAGMIDCPSLDELLIAVDGQTLRNGGPATTSGCTALGEARLSTTDPFLFQGWEAESFAALRSRVRLTRYGLDALAYARVATGGLDLVVESGLGRHDLDALVPVVRGAGGAIGDWSGGEDWDGGRIVAAASRALYEEAVGVLAR